jgi:hypothetical protein
MTTKPESLLKAKISTLLLAMIIWFVIRQRTEHGRDGIFSPPSVVPAQHE